MPTPPEDVTPNLTQAEVDLADRLVRHRPVPNPEFRGVLRRRLAEADPGYGPRPAHLRSSVTLFMGLGGALMLVGALQAVGQI